MIVKENVTVYQCEWCKKKLYREYAMLIHELYCDSNPENKRACFGCTHIETIQIDYIQTTMTPWGENEVDKKTTGFKCKKLDKIMYPFKVQKKGLQIKYPETFEGQEPMPKECEHWHAE